MQKAALDVVRSAPTQAASCGQIVVTEPHLQSLIVTPGASNSLLDREQFYRAHLASTPSPTQREPAVQVTMPQLQSTALISVLEQEIEPSRRSEERRVGKECRL